MKNNIKMLKAIQFVIVATYLPFVYMSVMSNIVASIIFMFLFAVSIMTTIANFNKKNVIVLNAVQLIAGMLANIAVIATHYTNFELIKFDDMGAFGIILFAQLAIFAIEIGIRTANVHKIELFD